MSDDIFKLAGNMIGIIEGYGISIIAVTLECPEDLIKKSIISGCKTFEEIKRYTEKINDQ